MLSYRVVALPDNRRSGDGFFAGFLAVITFMLLAGCSGPPSHSVTLSASQSVRSSDSVDSGRYFSLNENMIRQLATGKREDACDYSSVLPQLLAQIGSEATVYPSENYYYFSFNRAGSMFSGSLRLSSDRRDDGILDYVCYESYRSWVQPGDEVRVYKRLSHADGVTVEKLAPLVYLVKYGDVQTEFSLHKLDHALPGGVLLPSDIRVGRAQDESGAAFELLFNAKINNFYFVLDVPMSVGDDLVRFSPNTVISRRTGFVYYHNSAEKRYVLVAVNHQEILLNSFFDGPSDHLPENDYREIGFWQYVYKVYPDIVGKHLPGGSIGKDGMIFALAPYRIYDQTDSLGFIETCAQENQIEREKIACMIWGD